MARIKLTDTGLSAAMKMSGGNPGAMTVIMRCLRDAEAIDPDSFMGGMGVILALDTHGIYGADIWMLYKDVCAEDLRVMCALLRAVQLGFLPEPQLNAAIQNYGEGLDIPALVARVEKFLPAFHKSPVPAEATA